MKSIDLNDYQDQLIKTPFDDEEYCIELPADSDGPLINDALVAASNVYSSVVTLYGHYNKLLKNQQSRTKRVYNIALLLAKNDPSYLKYNLDEKKALAETLEIEIDGEKTKYYLEEQQANLIENYVIRGKEKLKELVNILDTGRSLLSWTKEEMRNLQ